MFRHKWFGNDIESRAAGALATALTDAAAEGERIQRTSFPVGWPVRTGRLSNSSGHEPAKREGSTLVARLTVGRTAPYWSVIEARTATLARAGAIVERTLPERIKRGMS